MMISIVNMEKGKMNFECFKCQKIMSVEDTNTFTFCPECSQNIRSYLMGFSKLVPTYKIEEYEKALKFYNQFKKFAAEIHFYDRDEERMTIEDYDHGLTYRGDEY